MKHTTFMFTKAEPNFDLLDPELIGLFDDNGGDANGPAWLPREPITQGEAQRAIDAGQGKMVRASFLDDDDLADFYRYELPEDTDLMYLWYEYIESKLDEAGKQWAHYTINDTWVIVNTECCGGSVSSWEMTP